MYLAILLNKNEDGGTRAELRELDDLAGPAEGEVIVRIDYSTVNYKDALAITGQAPVVRSWPMVPGIDGAGEVIASAHPDWQVGDRFILNGWGVGEAHQGCLATRARLKGDWLTRRPESMSARTAMAIGTAGYTAMLSVMALQEQGVHKDAGEILVTGATGGVGSIALALLSSLGYRAVAATGKLAEADYLRALGAVDIVDRSTLSAPGKALQKERWAGVIDAVGSHTLANALAQTRYGGVVTACGLAQGLDLPGSVAPFILRGIKLIGIDSVMAPAAKRIVAWQRLAAELDAGKLDAITGEIGLSEVIDLAAPLLAGQLRGRVVVDVNR
jgi:acrylyl-CoA reductase (NADPH)